MSNLIERSGCVAAYLNGNYRCVHALTRYEAAALLNVCVDRTIEEDVELNRPDKNIKEN